MTTPFVRPGLSVWLTAAGVRLADSADTLEAGAPTVLTDASLAWGRATTVDQPDTSVATFRVAATTGSGFLDALTIGTTVEMWAEGRLTGGLGANTMQDPGFESLDVGPMPPDRYQLPYGSANPQVISAPVHSGARAVRLTAMAGSSGGAGNILAVFPPAPFSTTDRTAWDHIPRLVTGETLYWSLAFRAPKGSEVRVTYRGYRSPDPAEGTVQGGQVYAFTGTGDWVTETTRPSLVLAPLDGRTAALQVDWFWPAWDGARAIWETPDQSWEDTEGSWADYGSMEVDDLGIQYTTTTPGRTVKVFTGRVTDQLAKFEDGRLVVDMTAADPLAELGNVMVGDAPFLAESLAARAARVMGLTGTGITATVDSPAGARRVTWRDVDRQAAAGLVQELAVSAGAVAWMATHSTTSGPYWWLEDPSTRRVSLYTMALAPGSGLVELTPVAGAAKLAELSSHRLLLEPTSWHRSVSDVTTSVDLTWMEQTLADNGTPAPTERHVTLQGTPEELARYGYRRLGVGTQLATLADGQAVAALLYARYSVPGWRLTELTWDTSVAGGLGWGDPETNMALDLLDGQLRLGHGLMVTDLPAWSPVRAERLPLYLEGGTYTFTGSTTEGASARWVLELGCSAASGQGLSGGWDTMDPEWSWDDLAPTISWADMTGVTGPVTP